jgi:hypothetical protein
MPSTALPAHVGSVKSWTPYGFSFYQDVCVFVPGITVTAGTDTRQYPVYVAQDMDVRIEEASIVMVTDATAGDSAAHNLSYELRNVGAADAGTADLSATPVTTATQRLANIEVGLSVDQNTALTAGDVLVMRNVETGTATANLPAFLLQMRIRRKA